MRIMVVPGPQICENYDDEEEEGRGRRISFKILCDKVKWGSADEFLFGAPKTGICMVFHYVDHKFNAGKRISN